MKLLRCQSQETNSDTLMGRCDVLTVRLNAHSYLVLSFKLSPKFASAFLKMLNYRIMSSGYTHFHVVCLSLLWGSPYLLPKCHLKSTPSSFMKPAWC